MALVSLKDYEEQAEKLLIPSAWEYYRNGACHMTTVDLNEASVIRSEKFV